MRGSIDLLSSSNVVLPVACLVNGVKVCLQEGFFHRNESIMWNGSTATAVATSVDFSLPNELVGRNEGAFTTLRGQCREGKPPLSDRLTGVMELFGVVF